MDPLYHQDINQSKSKVHFFICILMDPQDHQQPELRQVLVLQPPYVFNIHEHLFADRFHALKAYDSPLPTRDFLQANAQSVKVVLCSGTGPITADVIRDLLALKLVVTDATGVNHIDMAECGRRGIKERIISGERFVRDGCWTTSREYPLGAKLGGKRVGIVGLGNIGSRVATRLEAMGCIVSYTSRRKKQSTRFTFYPNILQLAFDSDALVLCCALTNNTRHMINNKVMMALGKKGIIVNVARGALIDEVELVKCLVEGEIGGVGLDVFESEPNVPRELFELDNVVLLPHAAAFTNESFYDVAQVMIANLEAFFANKPLLTLVNNKI
ncbi:putative oxidoreductase [Helianthus anomalus]